MNYYLYLASKFLSAKSIYIYKLMLKIWKINFYILLICICITALNNSFNVIEFKYITKIFTYEAFLFFIPTVMILIFYKLSIIFKAFEFYFEENKQVIKTSVHEAGHALVRELIFKKSNKISITKKSYFSCYKIVKNCGMTSGILGVSINDSNWTKIYIESLTNSHQYLYYNLLIFLSGELSEYILFDKDITDVMTVFKMTKDIQYSDFWYSVNIIKKLSEESKITEDEILNKSIEDSLEILYSNKKALIDIYDILNIRGYILGREISNIVNKNCVCKYKVKYKKSVFIKQKLYYHLSKIGALKLLIDCLIDFKDYFKSFLKDD